MQTTKSKRRGREGEAARTQAPRYQQLAEQLIGEIRGGQRPVGSTLPGEIELMAEFGVSRHTVREALRRLDAIGLIERRRRLGTRVRSREPVESYLHAVRSPGDLLQYPPGSRLEPIDTSMIALDAATARELSVKPRSRWFRLRALRRLRRRGPALCRVDVYVLPEFSAAIGDLRRHPLRIFELIERRFGARVAHVRVDISAHAMSRETAAALGTAAGSPSLRVVRRYFDAANRLFEVTVSEHPADRFAYSLDLRREWLNGGAGQSVAGQGRGTNE